MSTYFIFAISVDLIVAACIIVGYMHHRGKPKDAHMIYGCCEHCLSDDAPRHNHETPCLKGCNDRMAEQDGGQ
jgi:hypothetical protein